jgi:hypothetical protein
VSGLRGHLVRRAQQHAAGDAAFGACDCGPHGTRLGAFGQDHECIGSAGHFDELVAERRGAEPPGPGRASQGLQPGRIEGVGDILRHALDPFGVVDGQARVEITHPGRGLITVGLDEQNGQVGGRRGAGELADLRVGRGPRAQQQGG